LIWDLMGVVSSSSRMIVMIVANNGRRMIGFGNRVESGLRMIVQEVFVFVI